MAAEHLVCRTEYRRNQDKPGKLEGTHCGDGAHLLQSLPHMHFEVMEKLNITYCIHTASYSDFSFLFHYLGLLSISEKNHWKWKKVLNLYLSISIF